jgi:hypothetical protein
MAGLRRLVEVSELRERKEKLGSLKTSQQDGTPVVVER